MRITACFILITAALLNACAGAPPLDMKDVDTAITPSEAVARLDKLRGRRVLWGGVIVSSKNLEKGTLLELLAYPLNDRQRPRLDREPLGRFIVEHSGYLETVDYAPGRELCLTGTVSGTKEVKIDDTISTYPAITSEQLHLWPKGGDGEPKFHFGVGVMFHN